MIPNPLITPPSQNNLLMGALGTVSPIKSVGNKILPEMVFDTGGDAVGKEYHGWIAAFNKSTGKRIGYVDYTYLNGKTFVRMIETEPEFRRMGVATKLMEKLHGEMGGPIKIQGDFATQEGQAFWKSLNR